MFLVAARTAVWATNGQPFAACQRRFGAAIASATSPAAHGCQRARSRRSGVARRPSAKRDQIGRDGVFGEKRDAADRPGRQPPARVVVLFGLDDADGDREPRQRLQRVGRRRRRPERQRAAGEHGEAREPAGVKPPPSRRAADAVSATVAAQASAGTSRETAQRVECSVRGRGDQRHQRRLVGIAPGRMASADDEIELVAEIAI